MSSINISDTHDLDAAELQRLFESVGWESARLPERLQECMRNSHSVFSAWDGRELVGLANVLSDGSMTAFVPYLLVRPDYQRSGVGKDLLRRIKARYFDLPRIVLVSLENSTGFYEKNGFVKGVGKSPMYLTTLN